jgi:hypothetical protein
VSDLYKAVGPDAEIVTNDNGYKTSRVPFRWKVGPHRAMLAVANITFEGAKNHGDDNWKRGSVDDHIEKCLTHLFAYWEGDRSDDHLGHAAWRALAAKEIEITAERGGGSLQPAVVKLCGP